MPFFRSDSGIANQAIFSGARFIVYVEEEPDLDPGRSIDKTFWTEFFIRKFKEVAFDVKGLGGKSNVVAMAKRIAEHNIPNSLCALDRDYDDLLGCMVRDPRVFYTFGYGAENDLFDEVAAKCVAAATILGVGNRAHLNRGLWEHIEAAIKAEHICLRADQIAACRGRSVLNRQNPTSVLDLSAATLPLRFRRAPIRKALRDAKQAQARVNPAVTLQTNKDRVPSHLYFEIFYHTVTRFIKCHTKIKYSREAIRGIVTSSLLDNFMGMLSLDAKKYYRNLSRRNIQRFSSVRNS